jgi:hypothetical protein
MKTPLTTFFENNKTLLPKEVQNKLIEEEKEHIILAYEAGKCKGSLDNDEDFWGEEYFKEEYFKNKEICIADLIFHNLP